MSNNTEIEVTDNSNEWINWIEEAIAKNYFKHYEYKHFSNIQEIGSGGFGKVHRANWKNSNQYLALKTFFKPDGVTVKEIVHELKLQRDVDFHNNIIRFYGVTKSDSENNDQLKKYWLVIEYADGGTLRNYLKERFDGLTWEDKYNLAYQLACAVLCLHDEGIVHRDLHSNNVLVHQNVIKLADFGLSKRIDEASNSQLRLYGIIPYIDPKQFNRRKNSNDATQIYTLNEKSDVYSAGILLWEISSGQPPFYIQGEQYGIDLAVEISQGLREKPVSGTPEDYIKIYIDCWNNEPDNRPTINQVVAKLKAIIFNTAIPLSNEQQLISDTAKVSENIDSSLHGDLSQLIQNFNNMNTNELESVIPSNKPMDETILSENNFSIIVEGIFDLLRNLNYDYESIKQGILVYLNNHNITSQDIHNQLLNNQTNSNSVNLLGIFNMLGIGTNIDNRRAFELFQKSANLENADGMSQLGYCYHLGFGTSVDNKKAFELFQKAVNLGNPVAMYNLGYYYQYGIGTSVYNNQKAFELYQKSADLDSHLGQYNLAMMYEHGDGIVKDIDKAIYWYKKSAENGYQDAQKRLEKINKIKNRKKFDPCKIN